MTIIENIKLALVVAIVGGFCYIIYDYRETRIENIRLTTQLNTANSTITALDNLAKKNKKINDKSDGLVDEIEKETETNDANTAPVLRSAIQRLH